MPNTVIELENISKQYRLGLVGTNTLRGDITSWWYRMRGKEDPTLQIGHENRLDTQDGEYVWALQNINLKVQQGEILGIIGKNGAGKSTLLKILSRVTGPTTGQIKVRGRIASLLEVGTGFHGELTGRENIFLNGAILGMTKQEIRSKFDEIVDFAGVAKYIDTPVKRYSSGMYVRLAFAVAAHLEPEILIVDEVLAVGDAEFQKKAIGKMQDISSGGGRTVLFVSHNMASVRNLCTRGVLLENGRIILNNEIETVVSEYLKEAINHKHYEYSEVNNKVLAKSNYDGFKVNDIKLINQNQEESIVQGDDVHIVVEVFSRQCFENVAFMVKIKTESMIEVARFSTQPIGNFKLEINGKQTILLKIKSVNFNSGNYFLDIAFNQPNVRSYFYSENIIRFKILPRDVYESGAIMDQTKGVLWLPHKWEIK